MSLALKKGVVTGHFQPVKASFKLTEAGKRGIHAVKKPKTKTKKRGPAKASKA